MLLTHDQALIHSPKPIIKDFQIRCLQSKTASSCGTYGPLRTFGSIDIAAAPHLWTGYPWHGLAVHGQQSELIWPYRSPFLIIGRPYNRLMHVRFLG
jgi:hypothetical protein